MLSLLISLSTMASELKHLQRVPAGEARSVDLWCMNDSSLALLRSSADKCKRHMIELKNVKKLNEELLKDSTEHKPIWQTWWAKIAFGSLAGALSGKIILESTTNSEVKGASVGLLVSTALLGLEGEF